MSGPFLEPVELSEEERSTLLSDGSGVQRALSPWPCAVAFSCSRRQESTTSRSHVSLQLGATRCAIGAADLSN